MAYISSTMPYYAHLALHLSMKSLFRSQAPYLQGPPLPPPPPPGTKVCASWLCQLGQASMESMPQALKMTNLKLFIWKWPLCSLGKYPFQHFPKLFTCQFLEHFQLSCWISSEIGMFLGRIMHFSCKNAANGGWMNSATWGPLVTRSTMVHGNISIIRWHDKPTCTS